MNEYEQKKLDEFFATIEPNLPGYTEAFFSYVAFKNGDVVELAQGRLQLQSVPAPKPTRSFECDSVKAGIFRLSDLSITPRQFVDQMLTGKVLVPGGALQFRPEENRTHSIYFTSHDRAAANAQRREVRLTITGDRRQRPDSVPLDWELKSSPTPYFDFQELCGDSLVGTPSGDFGNVEVIAFNVAAIATESLVDGTKARVSMVLATGLDRMKASIGYRVFEQNRVTKRNRVSGSDLRWDTVENIQRGIVEFDVAVGAVIDCVAVYSGIAQQQRWVTDPKVAQNPLRSVHEAFDARLEVLHEMIAKARSRGANARDLEIAIAWLLWMLGFSVTHIGGTPKTGEAPDLIASTPNGDFVVIECTTGILKEDSKLSHLCQRAERVRQSLAASGNQDLRVVPIIVTTKSREEVKTEIEPLTKLAFLSLHWTTCRSLFSARCSTQTRTVCLFKRKKPYVVSKILHLFWSN